MEEDQEEEEGLYLRFETRGGGGGGGGAEEEGLYGEGGGGRRREVYSKILRGTPDSILRAAGASLQSPGGRHIMGWVRPFVWALGESLSHCQPLNRLCLRFPFALALGLGPVTNSISVPPERAFPPFSRPTTLGSTLRGGAF